MYTIMLLPGAKRDLAALDPQTARRIAKRLEWLADNFERVKPEALTGGMGDLFKLRVGDYRAVYNIVHAERLLRVYRVRHRREIYKEK